MISQEIAHKEQFVPTPMVDFYFVKMGQEALWALEGMKTTKIRSTFIEEPYSFEQANEQIMRYASNIDLVDGEAITQFLQRVQEGLAIAEDYDGIVSHAKKVREKAVQHNEGLVYIVGQRIDLHKYDYLDLLQEGRIALTRAVERFNPEKRMKFSTFACTAIQRAMERYISLMRYDASIEPEAYDHYKTSKDLPLQVRTNIAKIISAKSLDDHTEGYDPYETRGSFVDPTAEAAIRKIELEEMHRILKTILTHDEYWHWKLMCDGYSNEEISDRFGNKRETIAGRWGRITKKLRKYPYAFFLNYSDLDFDSSDEVV